MSLTAAPQSVRPADRAIRTTRPTPYLLLDVGQAVARYARLQEAFGVRAVHYAVKANPHPELLRALVRAGGRFDVASAGEVRLCLAAGADPGDLIFSNPVKRRADIAYAYAAGVRRFVADSTGELDKLADAAPSAAVLVRLATSGAGSDHPLSVKLGRSEPELLDLLRYADAGGLEAAGIAFHVGSQQRDPRRWLPPIAAAARVFAVASAAGLRPRILDIGGGLSARHEGLCPRLTSYVRTISGRPAAFRASAHRGPRVRVAGRAAAGGCCGCGVRCWSRPVASASAVWFRTWPWPPDPWRWRERPGPSSSASAPKCCNGPYRTRHAPLPSGWPMR